MLRVSCAEALSPAAKNVKGKNDSVERFKIPESPNPLGSMHVIINHRVAVYCMEARNILRLILSRSTQLLE